MADRLGFEIFADDQASQNLTRAGKSMKSLAADVELANVRMAKASKAAEEAVQKYGRESLQAREALARLAKAEDAAAVAGRRLEAAQKAAAASAEDAGEEAVEATGKWAKLKASMSSIGESEGAAAAGAAAAAAIGAGFVGALNIDAGRAKLTAQLGLTAEESAKAGRLAGDLYGAGFGDSTETVNEALRSVWAGMRQIGQGTPAQIDSAARAALTLSDVFGVDVSESVRAATRLIQTGLVKDSRAAFDLIGKGFQTGGDQADDMLDTITEYAVQFEKLGLSGQDAMSLLSQGLKAGARDTDYIADAVKEFTLIAVGGSKTAADGFRSIGLDAGQTAAAIARGGPSAREAFGQVLAGIRSISDPLERERVGVELFGTKWEDLGGRVVTSMSLADSAIGNTAGTIDEMSASVSGTGAAQLERFRRGVEGLVQSAAGAPGALGAAVAGIAVVGPSALDAAGNLGMMATGFKSLNLEGGRARGVLVGVGKAAAVLAAAQVAGSIFGGDSGAKGIQTTTKALREMTSATGGSSDVLKNLDFDLKNIGMSGRGIGGTLESLTGGFAGLAGDHSVKAVDERMRSLDAAMAALVSGGSATEAAALFDLLAAKAKEQGTDIETLRGALPQYQNALDGVTDSQHGAAGAANEASGALSKETSALDEATSAANEHASALLGLRGDEVGYWASVDATTEALKANGRTLDVHTEKGRANRTALDGQARAAADYLAQMQAQGAPAAAFNAQLDASRANLIKAATRFGMTKDAARAYANEMLGIPRAVETKPTFNKTAAVASEQGWVRALQGIPNLVETRAGFDTSRAIAQRNRWVAALRSVPNSVEGTLTLGGGRARGGLIPGAPSSRDNRLTPTATGEYVVNAAETSRHLPLLEAINSGRYRGYASGGYVGASSAAARSAVQILPIQDRGSGATVQLNVYAPIGSQAQLEDWLQRAAGDLRRKGRL